MKLAPRPLIRSLGDLAIATHHRIATCPIERLSEAARLARHALAPPVPTTSLCLQRHEEKTQRLRDGRPVML